jgi:hypothetical protein
MMKEIIIKSVAIFFVASLVLLSFYKLLTIPHEEQLVYKRVLVHSVKCINHSKPYSNLSVKIDIGKGVGHSIISGIDNCNLKTFLPLEQQYIEVLVSSQSPNIIWAAQTDKAILSTFEEIKRNVIHQELLRLCFYCFVIGFIVFLRKVAVIVRSVEPKMALDEI